MINITIENEPTGTTILIKRFGQHVAVERGHLDYSVNGVCGQLNCMFVRTQPVFISLRDDCRLRAQSIF